jgi:carboxymethylproline synthase
MSGPIQFDRDGVRVVQVVEQSLQNSFTPALAAAIRAALLHADADEEVDAIAVCIGSRSPVTPADTCAEVNSLRDARQVDVWLDSAVDLYAAVLELEKPAVAAVDGVATGMSFQFAMMFDWRLMASTARFKLPGLDHGICSPIGATILRELTTFNLMREILYRREDIDAPEALRFGLVNGIVEPSAMLTRAVEAARSLAAYPEVAFRKTKKIANRLLLDKLISAAPTAREAHRLVFSAQSLSDFFDGAPLPPERDPAES